MPSKAKRAKTAIDEMFRDSSVPQSETRRNLHDLIEHCKILIESLDDGGDD